MADRAGFDFVQKTIGKSLHKFADYFSSEPFVGINNDWFSLYTSVFGSLDYFHLVQFPLSGMYEYQHPMYLDGVSDGNTFGYINADINGDGKESHLVASNIFDINWAPCPNGNETYPAWDGWPIANNLLPDYPVVGITRIPVLMKGMMIRIDSSIATTYDQTFIFDATNILLESLRPNDYYDIRVYRYNSAINDVDLGWIPSGTIYELKRSISGTDLVIQIGNSAGQDIPNNEPRFFMIYWQSPDEYCATVPPVTTIPNDVSAFLTFNEGDTPLSRELFDTKRYDLIDFSNVGNKYLKNYYSTRYEMVDGNPQHYDDPNPIFYRLPAMRGSLDPAFNMGMPGIGNIWGYGYSLDQGSNNPTEDMLQGIIVCYQASAGNDTKMEVVIGPEVPLEFQNGSLVGFNWYPPVPTDYDLFAKIIIKKLSSRHQAAYRPNTIIEYLEYIKSYGKDKVNSERYFSYLNPLLLENAFLTNYLETILSPILIPIIYMTPVATNRIGGMQYNSLYILNAESIFNIFNIYWKIPVQHPLVPASSIAPVQNIHDYMNQQTNKEYGQLEFHEDIRRTLSQNTGLQLSTILGEMYSDDTNLLFGTKCYNNKKVYIPTKLQLHIPIINSCYDYSELPRLQYDYSFRLKLRSVKKDFIRKDFFVSASKYYINDTVAASLVTNGLNPEEYLWPAKLNAMNDWLMYGRTLLVPDLTGGENATIEMRQFKPRDESLPLYDEFVADLEVLYYDDLNSGDPIRVNNAQEAIADAITNQEYLYGGFDEPDTRTLDNLIYSMDEFLIGVSLYNATGIPYWDSTIDFWGGNPNYFDSISGLSEPRYGFTVNSNWYYQSFTESLVSSARREYIEEHPEASYILQEQNDDTGTPNNTFGLNDTKYALATTFTADFADVYNKIYKIKLKLRLQGVPTCKLILTINETNAFKVPTTLLQTSETVGYVSLSDEFEWIDFDFIDPVELVDGNVYALVLTAEDALSEYVGVDAINTIEWAYASVDRHSYGITDINSLLTIDAKIGDTTITVSDGSVFSTSFPFFIKLGADIFVVTALTGNILSLLTPISNNYFTVLASAINVGDTTITVVNGSYFATESFSIQIGSDVLDISSRTGNVLTLTTAATKSYSVPNTVYSCYSAGTAVYEVIYVAADSEVRWQYTKDGAIYNWEATTNPTLDATYQLYRNINDVGLVTTVPIEDWSGVDISGAKNTIDAFYISASTDSYYVPSVSEGFVSMFYGTLPGLEPFGGFNIANSYDFPLVNTWRAGYTNLVDGFISWSSKEVDSPVQMSIFPLAKDNAGTPQYLPTVHDMYVTAVCKKINGQKKVVNTLIPAGTNTPILLDTDLFIGIDLLWVDKNEFMQEPFYGYGPAESFVIRSI